MSFTSLRLSITVVDPVASVTRVVPAVEIGHIVLATAAYMDTTGFFQYKGEFLLATDNTSFAVSKPTADVLVTEDSSSVETSKPVPETATISDNSVLGLVLPKAEALTATDVAALSVTLATIVEGLTAIDSQAVEVQKPFAETLVLSDTCVAVLIFLRDVFDTVTATDTPAILFSTAYVETLTPSDASAFTFDQQLTETFAMNDLADIGDGIAFEFVDFTANVVSMSDATNLTPQLAYSDTISTSDTGVGSLQDYCDITYFAEDYVGSRFTF
jgi:hypothetical protein